MPEAWVALAGAIESIEEACQGAEAGEVRALLANLDGSYGALVSAQVALIEREPKKTYDKGAVKQLAHSPHAEARKRLEERFAEFISATQRWNPDCSVAFDETAMGKYKVKDYSRLRDETRRLASGSAL
ncbi:MAG: hypothetical protein ABIW19_17955 [Vicinamibacterales bacterium]